MSHVPSRAKVFAVGNDGNGWQQQIRSHRASVELPKKQTARNASNEGKNGALPPRFQMQDHLTRNRMSLAQQLVANKDKMLEIRRDLSKQNLEVITQEYKQVTKTQMNLNENSNEKEREKSPFENQQ